MRNYQVSNNFTADAPVTYKNPSYGEGNTPFTPLITATDYGLLCGYVATAYNTIFSKKKKNPMRESL